MRGNTFRPIGGDRVAVMTAEDTRHEVSCFADEVVIDFPSVAPAVDRIRRAFLADEHPVTLSTAIQLSPREAMTGATVPLEATYYSDRGLVCGACHQTTDSVEAIDGRSEGARQAYAEHAAAQGAIMAENRRPPPPAYRPEDDIQALRREVRELRRELG